MNLDIHSAAITAFWLVVIAVVLSFFIGYNRIREGNKLFYYRKRKELISGGWKWISAALIFVALAGMIRYFAEPVA